MSALSLTAPIVVMRLNGKPTMIWNVSHSAEDRDYFLRFIDDLQDFQDDLRDQLIIELKEFELWQRKPGF